MKTINIIIILLFMLFPHVLLATEPKMVCFDKVMLDITVGPQGPESCDLSMSLEKVIQLFPDGPPPQFSPDATHCTLGEFIDAGNCTVAIRYCCTEAIEHYNDFVRRVVVLTGVPFGQDYEAASLALNNFVAETATKQCAPGYQRVGFSAGVVYDFEQVTSDSVDVFASLWNRILCSKSGQGEMIPIGNIGAGGAGGYDVTYRAVGDALRDSGVPGSVANIENLLLPGSGGALDDVSALLTEIRDKPAGVGGGLSVSDTALAVDRGLRSALQGSGGVVTVTPSFPVDQPAYTSLRLPLSDTINFQERFSTFFNDMKATPLFSSFGLSPLGDISGGSSIYVFSAGQYGDVSFDLSDYDVVFAVVKGFVLLLGSFLTVRIVILKR
ncbi:MAG: hypothetical protein DDT19_01580 [Syntrophomonadaceae bacterium]|nr:hypothetical protein [Bacillota bacterium]